MKNIEKKSLLLVLLDYLHNHENLVYKLIINGEETLAFYETDFETDNGLQESDEGYEEYQSIVFRRVNNGTLFEISYHNLPEKVLCGKNIIITT